MHKQKYYISLQTFESVVVVTYQKYPEFMQYCIAHTGLSENFVNTFASVP